MDFQQLKEAFKNRNKIWEGLRNKIWKKEHIETIAKERLSICRSNVCGYWDEFGTSEKAVVRGAESCGACGCVLEFKTRSLSSECGLVDLEQPPLWGALTNELDEQLIKNQIDRNEV